MVAGFVVLLASLVVATNLFGARDALFGAATPPPRTAASSRAFSSVPTGPAPKSVLRSQPWWQAIGSFRGAGATTTAPVRSAGDAIQWRLRWSCSSGRFTVASPGTSKALVDATCPARRTAQLAARPRGPLNVTADGPWQLRVERQVDVPLVEPPLPAMRAPAAATVARGELYRIDQVGRGRVTLYRLPGGRHALRLQGFYVTPNVDLQVRLSPLRAPRTTHQYLAAPSAFVGPLDVTTGSLNFVLPARVDPARYRSVVIWCPTVVSAYAAATLRPSRAT
jgi:hypothetical protein